MPHIADTFHLDNEVDFEWFVILESSFKIKFYRGISDRAKAVLSGYLESLRYPGFYAFSNDLFLDPVTLRSWGNLELEAHTTWKRREIPIPTPASK